MDRLGRGELITKISTRRKVTILALLFLTAFLVPVGVRASNPPPLVTVVNDSTVGTAPGVCTSTNGNPVQVISDVFSIPSGHSGYILPPVFTALFGVSSTSNPVYFLTWYENSTLLGQYGAYAQPGGLTTATSFGQELSSSSALSFFNTAHSGLVTFNITINIVTTSGQTACVQNPYLNLVVIET